MWLLVNPSSENLFLKVYIIYPGQAVRDHVRVAVRVLSGEIATRQVFAHLGWRQLYDEWVYLHGDGAIGRGGPVAGVQVQADGALASYVLPEPPADEPLQDAVRASLRLLNVAQRTITVPLYGALWRSVLKEGDFSLHLVGPTGAGKTALAALAQQHFGAAMDARHLPAGWQGTANALEAIAFSAKDSLIVVDEFVPSDSTTAQALHRTAERLFRAQANRSGRQRMRADTTLRPTKPPRGLIVSTGEDVPKGQSLSS